VLEHLVRLLYSLPNGQEKVVTLNTRLVFDISIGQIENVPVRWRSIPPFGVDTIRPITYDVSDFHQLAARDYEDLLQVSSILELTH
jgi:hypothetical protein